MLGVKPRDTSLNLEKHDQTTRPDETTTPWDEMTIEPLNGYIQDSIIYRLYD